jgi:D-sedoheptulose 7-phosphate isomerase
MKVRVQEIIRDSVQIKEKIGKFHIDKIIDVANLIVDCYKNNGKVILFGNGGSAADSQHIAAELIGRFQKDRKALAAIALNTNASILTAVANDYGYGQIFAKQVEGLVSPGDIVIGISTSGASKNVISGLRLARQKGAKTIALTGGNGGDLAKEADVSIIVPSDITARIQETHIMIGHIICELVESTIYK